MLLTEKGLFETSYRNLMLTTSRAETQSLLKEETEQNRSCNSGSGCPGGGSMTLSAGSGKVLFFLTSNDHAGMNGNYLCRPLSVKSLKTIKQCWILQRELLDQLCCKMFQKDKKQHNSSNSQSRKISTKGKSVALGGFHGPARWQTLTLIPSRPQDKATIIQIPVQDL